MSDEISQAIQIIRLEFDGLRFGMDVTGGTVKQAKNLAVFIYALLTREKLQGKTSLKKMLSKDGSLPLFQANFLISGRSRLCPYQLVNSNQVRQGE